MISANYVDGLELRIRELQKKISDEANASLHLIAEAQSLKAERDALSQKLRAAQHEVEASASAWRMANKLKEVCGLVNTDAGSAIQWIIDNHLEVGQLAFATPQQHLSDVRAGAGRAGFVAGAWAYGFNLEYVEDRADEYVETLRRGKP